MKKNHFYWKLLVLSAAMLAASLLLSAAVLAAFADVKEQDYFAEPVAWAVENGITDGVSETQFAPSDACTRAQIVGFLWKLEGRPAAEGTVSFEDVRPGSWYYDAVRWAVSAAVTDGVTETRFAPDKVCTRAEGAAFLYKYYSRPAVSGALAFGDVSSGSWYHDAVLWGVQQGIINGVTAARYAPQDTFTRAHIVTMLHRAETGRPEAPEEGVYLGVEHYGSVTDPATALHLFQLDDVVMHCAIPSEPDGCALQNLLREGDAYRLWVSDGVLCAAEALTPAPLTEVPALQAWRISTQAGGAALKPTEAHTGDLAVVTHNAVYLTQPTQPYAPPVSGTPGRATVKNFLATALMPCGTTLYVYGGGWNWQDTGSGTDALTIGLADSWLQFFQSRDASYTYKDPDAAHSYYPFGGFNQYGHEGLDCSGFVGWAVYNTVREESGGTGFVVSAANQAKLLADSGLGSCTAYGGTLRPGDVFSMKGHVWISLGTCSDGSILILHSTPSPSRSGSPGGGVQLSAIGSSEGCEAYRLADRYMREYYPQWYARYGVKLCPAASYTACVGHFTWSADHDPDGFRSMTPAAVLENLF